MSSTQRNNVHPRTLPFDSILRSTYSIFHNNIFQRMAQSTDDNTNNPQIHPEPTHNHLQTPIGNNISTKPDNTLRLVAQNINGIPTSHEFSKWKETLQSTITHDIDVLCLSETNLEWKHSRVAPEIETITKRFFRSSRLTTASSSVKFDRPFKPGGVASLVTNEWTGRIFGTDYDPTGLGRWTTTKMAGRRHRKIAIITAYQVCKTSIHQCGITTCYAQQWHLLRAHGNMHPDPRRQFWTDLTSHIRKLQANDFWIILLGDMNTSLDQKQNSLHKLITDCTLVDTISHLHETTNQSSYSRGQTIIDFCLISLDVLPCVRNCGYLPLHYFCYSDHRGLFLDLDSLLLFGGSPPKIARPENRSVQSKSSEITKKFLNGIGTIWKQKNLHDRVERLTAALHKTSHMSPTIQRFAEKLDRDRTRGFLSAEKKCSRCARPPWSRPLHKLSRKLRYYQIVISDFKQNRSSFNALVTIQDEIDWRPTNHPTDIQEAFLALKEIKHQLTEIRKTADVHRSQDLQTMAQEAALAGDNDRAKILRRLHKAETTHKAFLKLRRFLKPRHTGGVTKLEIPTQQPNGTTTIETTEDPHTIEEACLTRNRQHFAQAQGSPFTIPPLSIIESSACGPISDAILQGRLHDLPFDIDDLPKPQQIILEELRQCCPTLDDALPMEDFKRRFTTWREDTSTSPSGMYLGLYKCLLSSKHHEDIIPDAILKMGEDIFIDIFALTNLACRFGFAFARWKQVVNCMIHKKVDSFLLDQLRIIHLFEADYNLAIGLIFGRYMIYRACDRSQFHQSQWGRTNRECEDVLMIKELSYNIAAMSRTDLATFDNDAKACYDRIVTRFALLCCRSYGAPEGACKMTATVLDNVIHKIKTAYGISEESYTNHPESPIHGVGQGSQDGSSLWGVSSSVLYKAVDRTAVGVTFVNPTHDVPFPWYEPELNRAISSTRRLDGFIDDTTGWWNRMKQELRQWKNTHDVQELVNGMQHDATTWQTFLEISGGKLAAAKCLYYLCHWQWTTTGAPTITPATTIGNRITLQNDGGTIEIPHMDATEAHLTLGVWKTPACNGTRQLDHLTTKTNKWTAAMHAAPVTKDEAHLSYSRIYIPSIRYGLGTCYFTTEDLLRIQRPAVNFALSKMGYNQHTPRAVVYGPRALGALGLPSLLLEQGLQQLQFITRHLRSPHSPLRPLFQLSIEWYRMLAGYSVCPLALPTQSLSHIEFAPWFKALQQFLKNTQHSLDIPNLYCPRTLREHDVAIMEIPRTTFSTEEAMQINRCRLFLRVHMVSEICSAHGGHLNLDMWRGQLPDSSSSTLLWPRQQRPPTTAWRTWRRYLTSLLIPNDYSIFSRSLPLAQPLGQWYEHFGADRRWTWLFSSHNQPRLLRYQRATDDYQIFQCHQERRNWVTSNDTDDGYMDLYPPTMIPCDVSIRHRRAYTRDNLPTHQPLPSAMPQPPCPYVSHLPVSSPPQTHYFHATDWSQCIHQVPGWEAAILPASIPEGFAEYINAHNQMDDIIDHCSDGSVANDTGSFGWAFGHQPAITFSHKGPAFGIPMDSYLAEGYGALYLE